MTKKSKSSAQWLNDHESDEYVLRARREGYRSRASYKLLEIDEKFDLLRSGSVVVDLGAAPGGWTQIAVKKCGAKGFVVGLDLLDIEPLSGTVLIKGDFTEEKVLGELTAVLQDRPVDLVISDMAPNLSGMKEIDQPGAIYLAELALEFACSTLKPGGALLMKCFEGSGIDELRGGIRNNFKQLNNFKPKASRGKSREIYVLGRQFKGNRP
jgi:23S rRNA (uridine2552-2'-O)-methyltransferase